MILATESLALALAGACAAYGAVRHFGRVIRRARLELRASVAAGAFALALAQDAVDELYWAVARWLGMPDSMVYGIGPGLLKFGDAIWIGLVIWLYSLHYRVAKAIGIPLICYAVVVMAQSLLG